LLSSRSAASTAILPGLEPAPITPDTRIARPVRSTTDAPGVIDDLKRNVYCILGIPVDAVAIEDALGRIRAAAAAKAPLLLSTANLNFLTQSRRDPEFRESLLASDLCTADGISIIWIARLLGVPLQTRVAGADILDVLRTARCTSPAAKLKVFLFGVTDAIAAAAARTLNDGQGSVTCVGWLSPGFGSVDEMSTNRIIESINASNADFLVVALGAVKGQPWLLRNHARLCIPVRSNFGAAVNFQAGAVRRAPQFVRKLGLEWLWRIKEEPHLWRRYSTDACALLGLTVKHIVPLAVLNRWMRWRARDPGLVVGRAEDQHGITLMLSGAATQEHVEDAIASFASALRSAKPITLDLSATQFVDARFFGLILTLRKRLRQAQLPLKLVGVSARLSRLFALNDVAYLLSDQAS